ncbi:MAG: SH3 domain-containing protein, partial [Candidatus Krumholzibacteria bacterium]|nr:SH3 domain-containing protein [Candidatus Krumholzibacteria bacterium]
MNKLFTDELENMKSDLRRVENQFVSLEKRLRLNETKASAVASVAEAQLLFEKMLESGADILDSLTVSEVTTKLKTSDEMIKKRNYAAAVYFSNRAMRILNQSERRVNIVMTDGDSRIIAVSLANVRSGPGPRYEIIEKLSYGTVIVQMETNANWSKNRTKDGTAGWVHKSLIR